MLLVGSVGDRSVDDKEVGGLVALSECLDRGVPFGSRCGFCDLPFVWALLK